MIINFLLLKIKDKNIIYNMTLKIILLIKIINFLLLKLHEQKIIFSKTIYYL